MIDQNFFFECPKCDHNLCLACSAMEMGYIMWEDQFTVEPT